MPYRKEHFTKEQHILMAKMSLATYYPPAMFEEFYPYFSKRIKADNFNDLRKYIGFQFQKYSDKDLYKTDGSINGYYLMNEHDLFCYIFTYENDIYVIFRGTSSPKNILNDLHIYGGHVKSLCKYTKRGSEGRLLLNKLIEHGGEPIIFPGFGKMLFSSIDHINKLVSKLAKKNTKIYISGQSLGGASATIYGFSLLFGMLNKTNKLKSKIQLPINICSFGSPKVGNGRFIQLFNEYIKLGMIRFDRVVSHSKILNFVDTITQLPPDISRHIIKKLHKKHAGFSTSEKVNCDEVFNKVLRSEEGEVYKHIEKNMKRLKTHITTLCKNYITSGKGSTLKHPNGKVKYHLKVQETKDITKECPYLLGTLCHGYYYGVNFMRIPVEIVKRRAGYQVFKLKGTKTGEL